MRSERGQLRGAALLLTVAVAAPSLAAQTTWIVDAANGTGAHFTDLSLAVAQASNGDTLRVRSGVYTGFTTGKSLRVIGEGAVTIQRLSLGPAEPVIRINGLAGGTSFVLKNVTVGPHGASPSGVELRSNVGRVHLEDVTIDSPLNAGTHLPGVSIDTCLAVTINGGRIAGRPAIACTTSFLVATGGDLGGGGGDLARGLIRPATAAVTLSGSTAYLSRTDVRGGSGSFWSTASAPAVAIFSNSELTVTGDASTRIEAGSYSASGPTPALQASSTGTVTADSRVLIAGGNGGPPIAGGANVVVHRVASLWAQGAPLSGQVTVELVSPAAEPIQIVASVPGDPTPSPFGVIMLDPGLIVPVFAGVQNASARTTLGFTVPNVASLRGLSLLFQAAHAHSAPPRLEFTNPVIVIIG